MNRLLVIFHLYYSDQLPYFIDKMSCLDGYDWHLLVTYSDISKSDEAALRAFKPDVRFLQTENVGYDIWPFIKAIQNTNLDEYDVVIKIHTKSHNRSYTVSINSFKLKNFQWRDLLVDSMLRDGKRVNEILTVFREREDVGMVCSAKLYTNKKSPEDCTILNKELDRVGIVTDERRFCAGTMMAFRASVLKHLQMLDLNADMFPPGICHSGGSLAHIYERILSLLAPSVKKTVYVLDLDDAGTRRRLFYKNKIQPLLTKIFALDRGGDYSAKYLTILGMTFQLDKGNKKE